MRLLFEKIPRRHILALNSPQIFFTILVSLIGARAIFVPVSDDETSRFIEILLPQWAFWMWAVGLLVGGVLTFIGVYALSPDIERAGIAAMIGGATVYVIAGITFNLPIMTLLAWVAVLITQPFRYWALGRRVATLPTEEEESG